MNRRSALKSLVALPGAAALAQEPAIPPKPTQTAVEEIPRIEASGADAIAETIPRFFSAEQFSTLQRLSDLLMPPSAAMPGALQAHAPEFLDFLIGQSPSETQELYRAGLDKLNAEARRRHAKAFAALDAAQADTVLAPLHQPWTYTPPADPLARFLLAAKADVMTATANSREWSVAGAKRSRRAGGVSPYWFPIDPLKS